MTRVLLDTHTFLWFVFDDPRISQPAARRIEDDSTEKVLSVVSLWEITIKVQLGKLTLGMELEWFFQRYVYGGELEVLAIELPHLLAFQRLPLHHRDPFDRLLVAQAQVLSVPLVTGDTAFRAYDLPLIW